MFINQGAFQPMALLRIAVVGFRNVQPSGFSSTVLQSQQRPFVKVSLLPHIDGSSSSTRLTGGDNKKTPKAGEGSKERRELVVGTLGGRPTAVLPASLLSSLNSMIGSERVERTGLLQNILDPWPQADDPKRVHVSLLYPLLQPIVNPSDAAAPEERYDSDGDASEEGDGDERASPGEEESLVASHSDKRRHRHNREPSASSRRPHLLPWQQNSTVVKVTLYEKSPSSFIDTSMGTVKVALRDILPKGINEQQALSGELPEMLKWFDVLGPAAAADGEAAGRGAAQVQLRMQLQIRSSGRKAPSKDEKETSIVLSALLSEADQSADSTMSTLWNFRDNVKFVQNLMRWLLDTIESFKNIFNWTAPSKTLPIYLCLVAIWLLCVAVPGRFIILTVGLYEFLYKFIPEPGGNASQIRFSNLLQSIANDDDLEQLYSKERKTALRDWQKQKADMIRKRQLEVVFKSAWEGYCKIKYADMSRGAGSAGQQQQQWEDAYLVAQGRRLVWWSNKRSIKEGRPCSGQVLLFGHAGLTQPSPVDVREVGEEHVTRLLAVFGSDAAGAPQKCTVLCRDSIAAAALSGAVQALLVKA